MPLAEIPDDPHWYISANDTAYDTANVMMFTPTQMKALYDFLTPYFGTTGEHHIADI
jgi:hypothetical protein